MALDEKTILKMERHSIQPGCWPTENQLLLLKACLLEKAPALAAWEVWRSRVDIDWIDEGSHRLLPLLYSRLTSLGVEDPLLVKAKGVYLYMLTKSHMMMHGVSPVLQGLKALGIECLVLKGVALAIAHYKNLALRPALDIDIAVPPNRAREAYEFLLLQKWRSEFPYPIDTVLRYRHSCGFEAGAEKRLDLHWNILIESRGRTVDAVFWDQSVPVQIKEIAVRTLSPTHHLFHNIVHGIRWNTRTPCRWAADAMILMNSPEVTIQWDELFLLADERRLVLPVREGLRYLRKHLNAPIPGSVLQRFENARVGTGERIAFHVHTHNKSLVFGNFFKFTLDYLKFSEPKGFLRKLACFPRYLQVQWRIRHLRLMPFQLIRDSVRAALKRRL